MFVHGLREQGHLDNASVVSQLADLFWNLEHSREPSVTPTMDLAKLALVTSRDEEDEEAESRGTDSSNDTDATLVEDSQSLGRLADADPGDTVLGKRARDDNAMDVDEVASPRSPVSDLEKNGYVMVSHPSSPRRSKSPRLDSASSSSSSSKSISSKETGVKSSGDKDVPKKSSLSEKKLQPTSDSVMRFGKSLLESLRNIAISFPGKQHDVSECMDNCMFQIEIALLNFNGLSDAQEKGSLVKRSSRPVVARGPHTDGTCQALLWQVEAALDSGSAKVEGIDHRETRSLFSSACECCR